MSNCELCGRPLQQVCIYQNRLICINCFQNLGTCSGCEHVSHCAFNEDTTMPKTVQQVIHQGNMQMVTQVKNPDLIAKTCHSCICWDGEGCCRENNYPWCKNHKEINIGGQNANS